MPDIAALNEALRAEVQRLKLESGELRGEASQNMYRQNNANQQNNQMMRMHPSLYNNMYQQNNANQQQPPQQTQDPQQSQSTDAAPKN